MTKRLLIKSLTRISSLEEDETLLFESGVNVIVGKPNTGKSKWLAMLDYLLGDRGKPEDAFGQKLAEKYDKISAILNIDGEDLHIERRWKDGGTKTKVFVNEESHSVDEFSRLLLKKLEIPILHFAKGNPYVEKAWPELSFRILFRHIYRQQRFWNDFADKQPESEQLASILQFTGLAEKIYSEQQGDLIKKRRELLKLESAKDQFLEIMDQVSKDLVQEQELGVALTEEGINAAINRIRAESNTLQTKRQSLLTELLGETMSSETSTLAQPRDEVERLGSEWAELRSKEGEEIERRQKIEARLKELQNYKIAIGQELSRMERVQSAGDVLADLRITHCPACDQAVTKTNPDPSQCFLCGQDLPSSSNQSDESNKQRIKFEVDQLKAELQEVNDLIKNLSNDKDKTLQIIGDVQARIQTANSRLQPIRKAAASIMPPEISILDMEVGRLQERINQLERIKTALLYRAVLSDKIDKVANEIAKLEAEIDQMGQDINYEEVSDWLSDGMNNYLNQLHVKTSKAWTQGRVRAKLQERLFDVTVGRDKWSTGLGGTLALYFLISYHYALLGLTKIHSCHYPGLTILDLPAKLEDGSTVRDKENFIVEPFISLLNQTEMKESQVIVTGNAFERLGGVNRIELNRVWVVDE